ncbi:HNH endonuclease [Streptomyces gilvifuscus]|uniref:HNH endonuclease n=1 Tax=Streptomyces gilvifuscus TaxID=1550617 RepID=UPI003A95D008
MYCGGASGTMDHVIPFPDGGADDMSNLVPACQGGGVAGQPSRIGQEGECLNKEKPRPEGRR